MVCCIADFVVDFQNPTALMQRFLKPYSCGSNPEISFNLTNEEKEIMHNRYPELNKFQIEIYLFLEKLLNWAIFKDAIFLHSSLVSVNGVGVAFTALSGTGKTTHTLLWQQLLTDKMEIINGDKPIIRFLDEISTPYGYGTPWCGKEGLNKNTKVPLKHICLIERAEQNSCEKLTGKEALNFIFNQIIIPKEPLAAAKVLEILDKLLTSCEIWKIKCNMDISAAKTAFNTIFKENINET